MADLLTAVAMIVAAAAAFIVAFRSRRLTAEVRGVKVTMETQLIAPLAEIKSCTEQTAAAVNHQGLDEPTMVQRLTDVEIGVFEVKSAVVELGRKFDRHRDDEKKWQNALVAKIGLDVRAANTEQTDKENP